MVELPKHLVDNLRVHFQVEEYIKTRRSEETKKYANIFIRFLNENATEWMRAKDIYSALVSPANIPYTSQVTRMLADLTEIRFLERREDPRVKGTRGSPPVYYRVPICVPESIFMSREELEDKILHLECELKITKDMLREAGVQNIKEEIEKRVRELEEP